MANGHSNKLGNGLNGRSAFFVATLGAIFGGFSGPLLLVKFGGDSVVRPDPFTGTQGQQIEKRVTALESHVDNHPDQTGRFDARLTALEAQFTIILNNQERIIRRLDNLNDR